MEPAGSSSLTDHIAHELGSGDPFAAAVRATRMPMIITDPKQPDNPIVFANDAFLTLTGYGRADVVGRNCRFLQGNDTDKALVNRIHEAVAARRDISVEIMNEKKDGTPFYNVLYIGPVISRGGELQYFFASQLYVTERAENHEALKRREAELRLIVEGARDYAIITTDPLRRGTSWSIGAESIFG